MLLLFLSYGDAALNQDGDFILDVSDAKDRREDVIRGQKRHINIWHINNFSVTPVTDPPGRESDSSRPGTRTKTFMFLGFRPQHINF